LPEALSLPELEGVQVGIIHDEPESDRLSGETTQVRLPVPGDDPVHLVGGVNTVAVRQSKTFQGIGELVQYFYPERA
jgi:hypothetical protein